VQQHDTALTLTWWPSTFIDIRRLQDHQIEREIRAFQMTHCNPTQGPAQRGEMRLQFGFESGRRGRRGEQAHAHCEFQIIERELRQVRAPVFA
jgi:hypothetical protein